MKCVIADEKRLLVQKTGFVNTVPAPRGYLFGISLVLISGSLQFANAATAASPREQLKQMVGQLQQSPNDNALREKIIRRATNIKPAPAIPEEAKRAFIMGNVFQKEAKDASGYGLAIASYRDALRSAPWWGDAYFNLAIAQESAGKFDEAIASLRNYIASALTGSAEARDAQNKIYALEAKARIDATKKAEEEKAAAIARSPEAQAKRERDEFAVFLRQNEGAIFIANRTAGGYAQAMIENGMVVIGGRYLDEEMLRLNPGFRGKLVNPHRFPVKQFTDSAPYEVEPGNSFMETLTFSRDGNTLTESFTQFPGAAPVVNSYKRSN